MERKAPSLAAKDLANNKFPKFRGMGRPEGPFLSAHGEGLGWWVGIAIRP
jgi:hypothetical protein